MSAHRKGGCKVVCGQKKAARLAFGVYVPAYTAVECPCIKELSELISSAALMLLFTTGPSAATQTLTWLLISSSKHRVSALVCHTQLFTWSYFWACTGKCTDWSCSTVLRSSAKCHTAGVGDVVLGAGGGLGAPWNAHGQGVFLAKQTDWSREWVFNTRKVSTLWSNHGASGITLSTPSRYIMAILCIGAVKISLIAPVRQTDNESWNPVAFTDGGEQSEASSLT